MPAARRAGLRACLRSPRPWQNLSVSAGLARTRCRPPRRALVVGVDGSPDSVAALRHAVAQARQLDAELEVVRVIPGHARESADAEARAMLGQIIGQQFPDGLTVPVRCRVKRGEPARVLAAVCAGADLLVIGARGRGHARMPGGHTVQRVLDTASCSADVCVGDDPGS